MMRSTLGAPLGGTTRGGHQGVESLALSLMTPPNFGGGGGVCFPLMVVVASAEPNVPVTTCAKAAFTPAKRLATASAPRASFRIPALVSISLLVLFAPAGPLPLRSGIRLPEFEPVRNCDVGKGSKGDSPPSSFA